MTNIVKKNSNIEVLELIRKSRLSPSQQAEAVAALAVADKVAALILQAVAGFEQLKERLAMQPSLKH
jgi:hypothetical protein